MAHILIDGYNILASSNFAGRDELLHALKVYQKASDHKLSIVFDGTQGGTRDGDEYTDGGIKIIFSPITVTADDVIEEMLESKESSGWVVVSSDRRIQKAAAKASAQFMYAHEFVRKLSSQGSSRKAQTLAPWDEGREDDSIYGQKPKKGPARRLSKKEKKRRKKMDKL